jgi:protein-S-isoprenylcysteine O-methyltransferase Ste14
MGALGFGFLLLFDLFSMNSKSYIKYVFCIGGFLLIAINSIFIILNFSEMTFSIWVRIIGGIFSVTFLILLIYSVFIEVGKKTYGVETEFKLVTTGTYALSRHPGVLWFFLLYICGYLLFQNTFVLYAGLVWTGVNVLYVFIQERFIFYKIFEGYDYYQKSTPMIIPNFQSFEKCITTLNWRIT